MSDEPGRRQRAALVYNPIKVDRKRLRARVEKASKAAGWRRPLFYETTPEDLGQDATGRALREGIDALLVAGGDGTVRAVAEALIESRVPLTIIPSGTGNILARNLGLPLSDPERIIRATFEGRALPIDIGMAHLTRADRSTEEHGFVVMAGIGLDAAMIANTSAQLKKTMGWIAYVEGAARALNGAEPFRIMYERGGGRLHTTKAHSMLFANCGRLPAGISLVPDASVTDGMLDVALIQPAGWFGWLGVWRKIWWDNSVLRRTRSGRRLIERRHDASVRYMQVTKVDAGVDEPHAVQLDGDEFGEAVRIHCQILPGALLVALPTR
ncbi:diacylglycerol kinase family protein [Microbacterium horticulturae]|uniref:Diacylglycerol kinase family protein n=1 Tax=Microbacterium horticulturae TaxID=3028316 RepID=A0ABY8C4A9_9MICO|nr:diacylglycerol kinase family protein [Microbacterium sp. KACC 23027]WEG09468.1 diacylglycerol kinase family protein [Microbacterium sp. KACC 23027]